MNPNIIEQTFQLGFKAHQANDFASAQTHYLATLRLNPTHSKAYYLLGSLHCQLGNYTQGIDYLDNAIALWPDYAEAYSNRGNALNQLQRHDEALKSYLKATSIKPDFADGFFNMGKTLVYLSRKKLAAACFDEAIRLNPNYAMAFFEKGLVEQQLKRYQQAIESFKQACTLLPNFAPAAEQLANAQQKININVILSESPSHKTPFKGSLETDLDTMLQHVNGLEELNLNLLALDYAKLAVEKFPDNFAANKQLGKLYKKNNQANDALRHFLSCAQLNPKSAYIQKQCGNFYLSTNQPQLALAYYERAYSLDKNAFNYYHDKGIVLRKLMQIEASLECIMLSKKAATSLESHAYADFSASLMWLTQGCYDLGWLLYESRWLTACKKQARHFTQPLWLGDSDISNQHILLHAEQGLGDTLQFFRYIPLVANLAADVTIEVQKPLFELLNDYMKSSQNKQLNNITLITKDNTPVNFDTHCPLMSLPLAFKTNIHSIPALSPPIIVNPEKNIHWQQMLTAKLANSLPIKNNNRRLKLGFVVSGNPKHVGDAARTISIAQLAPYLPDVFDVICLQKEFRQPDANFLANNKHLHYFGKKLRDFSDTAALISLLDIVVTVDTSVAHLAASMGKPTWILLPFSPDFRWLIDRTDSPWYPTVTLYRQTEHGNWDGIFKQLQQDLVQLSMQESFATQDLA